MSGHKYTNRLIDQKSPYLLQHAHNPVNWYPWGDEALTKAKEEDKPILFSCGYSTCHWCHVMERESFENEDVAEVMNQHFVAIKVDREERPDLDHIYMEVCQLMTGHGGWPLNVILTPEQKPVFAGTYFPREDRMGTPGLIRILKNIAEIWEHDRPRLLVSAQAVMEELEKDDDTTGEAELGKDTMVSAYQMYRRSYDHKWGGFGRAPKFPTPHNLVFLLRYGQLTGEREAISMAAETLRKMYQGGIYDHIGKGFARYSTDEKWLVPHFEKMLYDNALLAMAYLEAYQVTRDEWYANVAREIFVYLQREMTSPEGGFYSAQDADSEGEEGLFYLWTPEQIEEVLGAEAGQRFCDRFDIKPRGNFEGKSIPNLIRSGIDEDLGQWDKAKEQLYQVRAQRIPPFKDDKILTSWNGLAIAAFALGYRLLEDNEYREAAERAAAFIFRNLCRDKRRLLARYRDGEASYLAYLDDYAYLIWGLLELYQATFLPHWLREAAYLSEQMLDLFAGEDDGGLYYTGRDAEAQIIRPREIYDGATPSGNSVAALNLLRLARITGDSGWEDKAVSIIEAFSGQVAGYPPGYSQLLQAVAFLTYPTREVVLVGDDEDPEYADMITIGKRWSDPHTVLVGYTPNDIDMLEIAPYLRDYTTVNGSAAAYLCENYACQQPFTDSSRLQEMLSQ